MGKTAYLLLAMAGVFGFSAGVTPMAKILRAISAAGSSPVPSTVATAPAGRWVTLTDAKLRCESRAVYKDSMTFFLATDAGLAAPFLAQFVGVVACDAAAANIHGAFIPDPLTMADLAHYGVDAKGAASLRLFTPLATPKYLRMALVPSGAILLIGAGIAFFGFRGLLRARKAERR
jgi:hypothetical protein